jgi:hypothetical protein
VSALESHATAIFADTLPPGTIFESNITSGPALAGRTISQAVATTQIAPTILKALHLEPTLLEGVRREGTTVLPGLF